MTATPRWSSWIGEDRLIPLKAIAWLELTARREQGAKVDAKDVRKHLNDVLRLSQLLAVLPSYASAPRVMNHRVIKLRSLPRCELAVSFKAAVHEKPTTSC